MRRRRSQAKSFVVRRVNSDDMLPPFKAGQVVVGRQTRELQMGDAVLVAWEGHESIRWIIRQQGDLIYLLGDKQGNNGVWLPAKAIAAKIVSPEL